MRNINHTNWKDIAKAAPIMREWLQGYRDAWVIANHFDKSTIELCTLHPEIFTIEEMNILRAALIGFDYLTGNEYLDEQGE